MGGEPYLESLDEACDGPGAGQPGDEFGSQPFVCLVVSAAARPAPHIHACFTASCTRSLELPTPIAAKWLATTRGPAPCCGPRAGREPFGHDAVAAYRAEGAAGYAHSWNAHP